MARFNALGLLLLLVCEAINAECECLWRGSFSEVQKETDPVISGTVIGAVGNSIDVTVNRPLRGEESGDSIRSWFKTADYCRPPMHSCFPLAADGSWPCTKSRRRCPGDETPTPPIPAMGASGTTAFPTAADTGWAGKAIWWTRRAGYENRG